MHDVNGKPLQVGDTVVIRAVILRLDPSEDYCNVALESVHGRRPDGLHESFDGINTGVLEKIEA